MMDQRSAQDGGQFQLGCFLVIFAIFRPIELKFCTRIIRYRLSKLMPKNLVRGTVPPIIDFIFNFFRAIELKICIRILSDAVKIISPRNW